MSETPPDQPENAPRGLGCTAVVMPLVPMAIGELFGPVQCECGDCHASAWMIWMTPMEYDAAKSQTERHPIGYVFVNKIGTARCDDHSPDKA